MRTCSRRAGVMVFGAALLAPFAAQNVTSLRDRFDVDAYPSAHGDITIYSDAFDQLPAEMHAAIYNRLVRVLSGAERQAKYARLTAADRSAVLEILRDTKRDWRF